MKESELETKSDEATNKYLKQLTLMTPLIFIPYLNRARKQMNILFTD